MIMLRFVRAVLALIILAVAFAVLTFVLENQQIVSISFMGWGIENVPISIFIAIALIAGMLIGSLFGGALSIRFCRKSIANKKL